MNTVKTNGLLTLLTGLCLFLYLAGPALAAPVPGVYRISTRGQPGMCLEVASFRNANGTPVQIGTANHTSNQQWLVERQADRTYKVYAFSGQNSMQMLDCANGATGNGNSVITWEDNDGDAQRWYFRDVGGGWYRIIPKNAGSSSLQTLDIRNGNNAGAGDTANIQTFTDGDNQVFRLEWSGPSKILPNPKKGIGGRHRKAPALNASWFYTWGGDRPADTPTRTEFVPMVWGYYGNANNGQVNWLRYVTGQPGVKYLLGYNEPDSATQANLPVEAALEGWQYMVQTGLPLGSPATVHADNPWMRDFMAGAAQRRYRVDFVCIHWYGGADPWSFLNHVEAIHNLYGKPIWITEFAPADWSGNRGITPQQVAAFMRVVLPELNRRAYVQRYAWFSAGTDDAPLGAAALVQNDGTLTELGRLYARL